jgi:phytoene/squalene synthetase
MKNLYDKVSFDCSRYVTKSYSTSFSMAVGLLDESIQAAIHSIYGFVRFADEIVDTFHDYDKEALIDTFERDTYEAIESGISLNPILNSFQLTVNRYHIDHESIDAFFKSMKMDLKKVSYDDDLYKEYIYGSADVVGLMCLRVFVDGEDETYHRLKPSAMRLGSAFQKVNFLRDMRNDYELLNRTYFPNVDMTNFSKEDKQLIEEEIAADFAAAYEGIVQLPENARMGVYIAYIYYKQLFRKIRSTPPAKVLKTRIRINNGLKYSLIATSFLRSKFNLL